MIPGFFQPIIRQNTTPISILNAAIQTRDFCIGKTSSFKVPSLVKYRFGSNLKGSGKYFSFMETALSEIISFITIHFTQTVK